MTDHEEKLYSLLTATQRTLLRGASLTDSSSLTRGGVRVYFEPTIQDFIGEVRVVLEELDADTHLERVYSVTPTGQVWDDYEARVEV